MDGVLRVIDLAEDPGSDPAQEAAARVRIACGRFAKTALSSDGKFLAAALQASARELRVFEVRSGEVLT